MAKATTKKSADADVKPDKGHLDTGVDGQPTADTAPPEPEVDRAEDPAQPEPVAEPDENGQPEKQHKVDQTEDVEHPTVAPGNEEAAKPLHNPKLVEKHANQVSHVVGTEQTKDHSDPSEVAAAALADPNVPLGQDADPNGPDDIKD